MKIDLIDIMTIAYLLCSVWLFRLIAKRTNTIYPWIYMFAIGWILAILFLIIDSTNSTEGISKLCTTACNKIFWDNIYPSDKKLKELLANCRMECNEVMHEAYSKVMYTVNMKQI